MSKAPVRGKKSDSKALVKAPVQRTAVGDPRDAELFGGVAGLGMENVGTQHLIIPRIAILQKLSPQVDQDEALYIDGAEPGDFCDIGMGQLIQTPMLIVPCYFVEQWLEWAPRKTGKGLVKIHNSAAILDDTEKDQDGRNALDNGNYIVQTYQFFCLNLNSNMRRSFFPLASTQLKKGRQILTQTNNTRLPRKDGSSFAVPLFYYAWECSTVEESNEEGKWFGWKLEPKPISELENRQEVFEEARAFAQTCIDGQAKADHTDATAGAYGHAQPDAHQDEEEEDDRSQRRGGKSRGERRM